MDSQKVETFIITNSKYFEKGKIEYIRQRLLKVDETQWSLISETSFNDPIIILVVSILVGCLGIDRFLIGDIGVGVAKLLTCGGLGLWTIIDWFIIQRSTREKNFELLNKYMS